MKIDIDIKETYKETSIVIKTPKMNDKVTRILNKLKQEEKKGLPISGKFDDKIYILDPNEIMVFYSLQGKVYAQTRDKELEIKYPLYHLEEMFESTSFIRVSQSAIVNIAKIKNVQVSFNGSLVIKLNNGHDEIISRRFVSKFKKFINIGGKYNE